MNLPGWLRPKPYEPYRWQELADYNGRLGRGIVHTPQFVDRMALEQARFDVEMRAQWRADPDAIVLARET